MAQAKQDALKQLLLLGGSGLALGIGGRSLLGLSNMVSRPNTSTDPLRFSSPIPTPMKVPVPRQAPEDEEEMGLAKAASVLYKHAMAGAAPPVDQTPGLGQRIQQGLGSAFSGAAEMLPDVTTKYPLGDSWGLPAAALAAGGGLGLGWGVTNSMLKGHEDKERERELAAAEADYRKSLSEQYQTAMMAKNAGDDLGIDDLFDLLQQKQADAGIASPVYDAVSGTLGVANSPWSASLGHDKWQALKGLLGVGMVATGGGLGYATYNWAKSRDQHKQLEKAIRMRARLRGAPTPFNAVPEYENVPKSNAA
jgi:hypothetical protein